MDTGTTINAALFITPTVFLPQTPDFVEREREREREKESVLREADLETRRM